MRTLLLAALLALPAAAQELYELDKGKSGREPRPAPSWPPSSGELEHLLPDEAPVGTRTPPPSGGGVAAQPAIDSAAALKRIVDAVAAGTKVAAADLAWAKGVAAGELARLAAGDAELKFRAELSCAADAKKGAKCSGAERTQQLAAAKKADYEKIKALLDAQ